MTKVRRRLFRFLPFRAGSTGVAEPSPAGAAGAPNPASANVTVTPADRLPRAELARHERYMTMAAGEARRNPQAPFGAMVVNRKTGEVVCQGVNASHENPTLHGEIAAINACAARDPDLPWADMALYASAEPCPMCAGAIAWAGVGQIVYGTSIATLTRLGIDQIGIDSRTVLEAAPFYRGAVIAGVLAHETDKIYQAWAASLE
jgi:tRNA(Arg) A34 adenosine deaminase TadA